MVFWLAVVIGGLFAWIAVQIGFFGAWIMFFNLLLSACMAFFIAPVVVASVPAATEIPYGDALTLVSIAVATLFISYGICYAILRGHLRADFPRVFDNTISGLLGFLAGFLVCSFLGFAMAMTPVAETDIAKTVGLNAMAQLDAQRQPSHIVTKYLCWWCDRMHGWVGRTDVPPANSAEAVAMLLKKPGAAPAAPMQIAPGPAPAGTMPPPEPSETGPPGDAAPVPAAESSAAPAPTAGTPDEAEKATPSDTSDKPVAGAVDKTSAGKDDSWGAVLGGKPKADDGKVGEERPSAASEKQPDSGVKQPGVAGSKSPADSTKPKRQDSRTSTGFGTSRTGDKKTSEAAASQAAPVGPQGPLAGIWQAASGAMFRIDDDGATLSISVAPNDVLRKFSGKLKLLSEKDGSKTFGGPAEAIFAVDARRYGFDVTAVLSDGALHLRCANWPMWNDRGKYIGRQSRPESEILTHIADSPAALAAPDATWSVPTEFRSFRETKSSRASEH
jgi:hypothetical protein